jgi:transposase
MTVADHQRDHLRDPERPALARCTCRIRSAKTIYNRFIRWSRLGVFNRIFAALAAKGGKPDQLMIDATHLKAHRTAASLLKKGLFPDVSDAPKAA